MPDTTTAPAPPTQPPQQAAHWDEEAYEKALAHLEQLQDQLQSLRTTLPSLIRPLTHLRPSNSSSSSSPHSSSPSHLSTFGSTSLGKNTLASHTTAANTQQQTFARLAKSAKAALSDVRDFRTTWTSATTQGILKEAKKSAEGRRGGDVGSGRGGEEEEVVPVWGWVELCEEKYGGGDRGLGREGDGDGGEERGGHGGGQRVGQEEGDVDVDVDVEGQSGRNVKVEMTDGEGVTHRGVKRDSDGIVKTEDQ